MSEPRFPGPDEPDPFASVPGGVPPSPFNSALGAEPPWLAGRHQVLQAAADQLRVLLEGRPAGPLGLHGPMGIGKTAVLARVAAEADARGGAVAWVDPHNTIAAIGALANAHQQLDPAGPSASTDSVVDAATAASEAARASGRPLLVIVDDAHAATDIIAQVGAAHQQATSGTPASIVLAGAHSHGTLKEMPAGLRSLPIDPLTTAQAVDALARPLERNDLDLRDAVLEDAAERSRGVPLVVQAWGEQLWQSAHQDGTEAVVPERLQRAVDARVGRVYNSIWAGLTDTDRNYVAAIATETGDPVSSSDAATNAGYDSGQQVSPVRAKLIDQGILHAPARGQIEVAIAGFGRWYHERRTFSEPAGTQPAVHGKPAVRPAAEETTAEYTHRR